MSRSVYLDYAAATPTSDEVLKAMQPYFNLKFFNPSANYLSAKEVKKDIESARAQVAIVLGAKSNEIVFTAGGTEANNLAIKGVMESFKGTKLIISSIEHPSIYECSAKYEPTICPVDDSGLINTEELKKQIDDRTVLVSIMYVNNEIGVIQPLNKIAELIKDVRRQRRDRGVNLPIYLHSDACQAPNYLDLHASRLGVDLMTLNGGKIYGPKQSGALFIKSGVKLSSQIEGGGQELGLRSGTENVAGIIGFSKALEIASKMHKEQSQKTKQLSEYFMDGLGKNPKLKINGSITKRIANNIHATLKGIDNEWLLIKLDAAGIMAAAGSACSASSLEPSRTLSAIGLSDEQARSSIRFSLGRPTTKKDLDYVVETLAKLTT